MFLSSVSSRSESFILGETSVAGLIRTRSFLIDFSGHEGKYCYLVWVVVLTDNDVLDKLSTFNWDGNDYRNQDKNRTAVTIKEVLWD